MVGAKLRRTTNIEITEMLRTSALAWVIAVFSTIAITGCERNSGEAVVLGKEHIDAAPPTETRAAQPKPGPDAQLRAMADDEIAVDGYVMQPEARD